MTNPLHLLPIHPFPARMAPHLVLDSLPNANGKPLNILDPMVGSGTTIAAARLHGHAAYGCDTDPLAALITRVWVSDINSSQITELAQQVQSNARRRYTRLKESNSYPNGTDLNTKQFIDYWFDEQRRRELTALSREISTVKDFKNRNLLWCAFSRLIIAKSNGASLAKDLSHSRPHKVANKTILAPIENFVKAVDYIVKKSPFVDNCIDTPKATIRLADARRIPFPASFFDIVITSPPYLNAIDYIRCNKFSLVWMGHSIKSLSIIRGSNVGAESATKAIISKKLLQAVSECCDSSRLTKRNSGILIRYAHDANALLRSISRVMKVNGKCKIVIGDCVIQGTEIRNSNLFMSLAQSFGFSNFSISRRIIEPNRRYMPAPSEVISTGNITNRLREEIVIDMVLQNKV